MNFLHPLLPISTCAAALSSSYERAAVAVAAAGTVPAGLVAAAAMHVVVSRVLQRPMMKP